MKVFLGGTCGESTWRSYLTGKDIYGNIVGERRLGDGVEEFNPQLPPGAWNEQAQKAEDYHKEHDDIVLYVITPETKSPYSISEITRSAIVQPNRTMVCVLPEANGAKFEVHEAKAWQKILKDIAKDGATVCATLNEAIEKLNSMAKKPQEPGDAE